MNAAVTESVHKRIGQTTSKLSSLEDDCGTPECTQDKTQTSQQTDGFLDSCLNGNEFRLT